MKEEILNDHNAVIACLEKGGNPNTVYNTLDGKGDSGRTPLLAAIRNGNIQVAHALINAGADVNAQSHDGYTALHIAAQNDKLLAIIRALIATGANPNIANNNGNTPLLMAVKAGDIRISRILIDVGSDVNIPYLSGDTALHLAAKNRHLWPLVNPLIAAGADPNIANGGVTPLHLAAERRYPKNG